MGKWHCDSIVTKPGCYSSSVPQPALTCLIIADDLTGACDAGVQFAARGCETRVRLWVSENPASIHREPHGRSQGQRRPVVRATEWGGPPGLPCFSNSSRARAYSDCSNTLAVSTESRALAAERLPAIFAEAARRLPEARTVFKKIDSTLRGNVGAEVALAAEAFGCDAAVITPAFPAMGRTVVDGFLHVGAARSRPRRPSAAHNGSPCVEMRAYWRAQKLEDCVHTRSAGLADALAPGARFVSLDAGCDEDLDSIAAAGLASRRRILWAGSAGLAAALARALWGQPFRAAAALPSGASAPVLFCLGSVHPVTTQQVRSLLDERSAMALSAEDADPAQISHALAGGRHVALRIPYARVSPERLASLIGETRAPIFVTGGDTASLLWRALGVREALLQAELSPGIPLSVTRGGRRDGATLVTKSGGFGRPGALVEIADYFCPL